MQKTEKSLPVYLNMDSAFDQLTPNESPFIKSVEAGLNENTAIGSNNPTEYGQNAANLTPSRSNVEVPGILLPPGYNKNAGKLDSFVTRETYLFQYNDQGNHSIWVLSGDTGLFSKVIQDPKLPIVSDQAAFIADHRAKIRVVYDEDGNIIEKFLLYTNGAGWQGWINVIAAISTNGFDATRFPYYTLRPPHFDRRELLEWAVRPPMQNPTITPISNTLADLGTVNRVIDQAFRFACVNNNTDGRASVFSPYSLPFIIKSEDFLNNPDVLPKKGLLTLPAGSPLTESIDIMIQFTAKKQLGIPSTAAWGTWQKYIRLYKYGNQSDVLQTQYWLRTNPWDNYNYDPIQNTIQYVFDNSVLPEFTDQNDAARIQSDLPIQSVALTDINGNAVVLSDNLKDYNNFPDSTIANLDVEVIEKPSSVCNSELRKVTLYAVAGRPGPNFTWESQVGYFDGQDTQVRWGSTGVGTTTKTPSAGAQLRAITSPIFGLPDPANTMAYATIASFNVTQSKEFGLDFADHSAFVCYAKGTPYYVVGQWYLVDSSNILTKLDGPLDFSSNDVLSGVQSAYLSQKYYICVFTFELPAGHYDFCIGRHNVDLTADFKDASTYVYGIANSRKRFLFWDAQASFLTPQSIVSFSTKEMEIDCTNGDVDVWGNGHDVFFIYCPYPPVSSSDKFRFIEGYFKESQNNQVGVELFPYFLNIGADDWGQITDKNGFYWAYTKKHNSDTANIEVRCKLNCTYPFNFEIPTSVAGAVLGPINNGFAYITDHNNGVVGDCNRILIKGTITDLTGTIPYSNIAVSIANGSSTVTALDGTFTLVVHNGQNIIRIDNIYVGAAGNFLITLAGCIPMPLTVFNESLAPCFNCNVRNYPILINFQVIIQGGTQQSLKQNATKQIGISGADLAGRLTYVNIIKSVFVQSFIQRQDILATFFRALINGPLNLDPDIAWAAFYVSNSVNFSRYFQWVGDYINYIDNQGNVVNDPSTAVFISIGITSLYNFNISKNFSVLASYQFSPDDRIRFMDDGNGNLLTSEIDLPILGTTYNQAMQNAGIVPNTNTVPIVNINNNQAVQNVINTGGSAPSTTTSFQTQVNNISVTLYVKFDSRLAQLLNDTGFWIEIYTPAQEAVADDIPYNELIWYPVINGEIAIFQGYSGGGPLFNYPQQIDLPFWDTYLYFRNINIPNVGDKFLNHPFESPNISDSFGANVSSGGRKWEKNDDAVQRWLQADMIPSDDFVNNGLLNGLGTFRTERRKDFGLYPFGAIQATHTERSIILIVCENDWFTVSFEFHFTFPNPDGVMVTNLDGNISKPAQKIGSNYGMSPNDTGTFLAVDHNVFWYDKRNAAWVRCDYRNAVDASYIEEERGEKIVQVGVKSYFVKKSQFISNWNNSHTDKDRFDVVAGVDSVKNNIHITFRPRRNNSNNPLSYANKRRSVALSEQETLVYNTSSGRWTRFTGSTPEGYAEVKGTSTGIQFISFAAGKAYYHNSVTKSFLNFYGVQTEPVLLAVFNRPADMNKVLVAMSYDTTDSNLALYIDLIYTSFYNSFSYIPVNYFKLKSGQIYSQALRDMNSYPSNQKQLQYLNMMQDGKRMYDVFFIIRFVGNPSRLNKYFQLSSVYALLTEDNPVKK